MNKFKKITGITFKDGVYHGGKGTEWMIAKIKEADKKNNKSFVNITDHNKIKQESEYNKNLEII